MTSIQNGDLKGSWQKFHSINHADDKNVDSRISLEQKVVNLLNTASIKYGIKINDNKTQVMKNRAKERWEDTNH